MICKATEGTGFVDRYCDGWIQKALQLGKKVGVYHFATGKSSGVAEADFFYKNIKGYVGKAILVLDWESKAVSRGVSYAKAFLDRIYQLTGVKPLIYMSNSVVHAYDWSSVVNADYGLWNAGYFAGIRQWDIIRMHRFMVEQENGKLVPFISTPHLEGFLDGMAILT